MSLTSDDYFASDLSASGCRFAIVVSRFNLPITDALLDGATPNPGRMRGEARGHRRVLGTGSLGTSRHRQPRGWPEGPSCGHRARVRDSGWHTTLRLRGREAARGLAELARVEDTPVAFGLLTTDDEAQARARAGGDHGNKGEDAAKAAMEMIDVYRRIEETS